MKHYHLIGIGIGPFNLSLAALLKPIASCSSLFFDQKPEFQWHPELMFPDSQMQTSFLKDLVSPVDPTNPYSFMNYLVKTGLFYAFMAFHRKTVSRLEFEKYCQWVAYELSSHLQFNTTVESVSFNGDHFVVSTSKDTYTCDHISVATGLSPNFPECTTDFLGPHVFHAKSDSSALQNLSENCFEKKRVAIIGGGQTGIEVFRNGFSGRWGRPSSIHLVTQRQSLEPLDESPFANEYFTPSYVEQFLKLPSDSRERILKPQKLAGDGNTPDYLVDLYQDLYQLKHIQKDPIEAQILPYRTLTGMKCNSSTEYSLEIRNDFRNSYESLIVDKTVLCTGLTPRLPKCIRPLISLIPLDGKERMPVGHSFEVQWNGPPQNKIFALNFSRHVHGIAEPQTSLMAWRSARVINHLLQNEVYGINHVAPGFAVY